MADSADGLFPIIANARVSFVERFWAERDTLPGVDGRSFRQEFDRRVAFADTYLAQDGEQRGSLTDRGMVFVLLGPPTNARRRGLRSEQDPSDSAGTSRVETQAARNPIRYSVAPTSSTSWYRYVPAEYRSLSTDDEYLEVWTYDSDLLPRGVPHTRVDVHYVTKKGGGKNILQPDTSTRATLRAAKSAATPGRAGSLRAGRR